jgi:5-(carboxyamino)imidazole ribonucleotide synthase
MLPSGKNPDKPSTLGIIGGNQHARMLALTALRLGLDVSIIADLNNSDDSSIPPSFRLYYDINNNLELKNFISDTDIVIVADEYADMNIIKKIAESIPVFPLIETIDITLDKLKLKQKLKAMEIPVPYFSEINSLDDTIEFSKSVDYPFLIKSRRYGSEKFGYTTIFNENECITYWNEYYAKKKNTKLIAEAFVDYQKDIAVIIACNSSKEYVIYPCVESVQYRHVCHSVIAPADISPDLREKAQDIAYSCIEAINGIGLFSVDMFLTKSEDIYVNKIIPRPNNSGHFTIEACYTSQFENCIRAVYNLQPGSSRMIAPAAATVNIFGTSSRASIPSNISEVLRHDKIWLHLYNKTQNRSGRKMGHITAIGNSQSEALNRAQSAANGLVW